MFFYYRINNIIKLPLVLLTILVSILFAQEDFYESPNDTTDKRICIAKGRSGLEYTVAQKVKERFENHGYSVDIIEVKYFDKQKIGRYDAVLVMHAVKRGAITRKVQQVISEMSEKEVSGVQPYIFIATVSGDEWSRKKTQVDATTAASSKENAEKIAQKLITRLEKMLLPE